MEVVLEQVREAAEQEELPVEVRFALYAIIRQYIFALVTSLPGQGEMEGLAEPVGKVAKAAKEGWAITFRSTREMAAGVAMADPAVMAAVVPGDGM